MEIRHLECFVAVAEELHFRRAGERLGLSQSALSERITALEHEIGIVLFFRTTRQVSLTQAGADFLSDAREILAKVDKSLSKARHASITGLSQIRISGVDEAISIMLPPALLKFKENHPSVHFQILEISHSDRHSQELINHRTDVAFLRAPNEDDFVTCELLYSQDIVVVMSKSNPLSQRENLSVLDIVDEQIVGYPKHARPILHEMLWSGFRELGLQPNVVCEVIDKSTLLQFVEHGLGIGLAPAWVEKIAPPSLCFVPLVSAKKTIDLYIAYRKNGNSPILEDFVNIAKSTVNNI